MKTTAVANTWELSILERFRLEGYRAYRRKMTDGGHRYTVWLGPDLISNLPTVSHYKDSAVSLLANNIIQLHIEGGLVGRAPGIFSLDSLIEEWVQGD